MRLIGYIRVSRVSGRSGDSFMSPDLQLRSIEAYAAANGHEVVSTYTDLDQSGGKASRPQFDAALAAMESGEADGLIVARLDRFMRSLSHALTVIERIESAGKQLISVSDNFDSSTPMGRFARDLVLRLGQLERERIGESWQEAVATTIGRGVHISNVPPFGYRRAEDGRLEPDPATAPLVGQLFERRAAGESWRSLCEWLDSELPSPSGGTWTIQTLTTIVKRRTYRGEAYSGELVNRDAHPALVDEATWQAAQGEKATHSRDGNGGALLAGLLKCATCGGKLIARTDGKRGYRTYRCPGRRSEGMCSARAGVSMLTADVWVTEQALPRMSVLFGSNESDSRRAAQLELDAARAELEALIASDEDISPAVLAARSRVLEERITLATENLGRSAVPMALTSYDPRDGELEDMWTQLDTPERRNILSSLVAEVVVAPAGGTRGPRTPIGARAQISWR